MSEEKFFVNKFLYFQEKNQDDYFYNSLIYIFEHNEDGALGIVMNKVIPISENIIFKTISFLSWSLRLPERVDYIVKVDDDVYLNAYELVKTLKKFVFVETTYFKRNRLEARSKSEIQ